MIVNEREYRATLHELEQFEEAVAQIEASAAARNPIEQRTLLTALRSDADELRRRITEFEQLQHGKIRALEAGSLEDLAELVVTARTASGMTQRQLAELVGIKPQHVQRYEATRYAGVSIERLQAVIEALEVAFTGRLVLPANRADVRYEPLAHQDRNGALPRTKRPRSARSPQGSRSRS